MPIRAFELAIGKEDFWHSVKGRSHVFCCGLQDCLHVIKRLLVIGDVSSFVNEKRKGNDRFVVGVARVFLDVFHEGMSVVES